MSVSFSPAAAASPGEAGPVLQGPHAGCPGQCAPGAVTCFQTALGRSHCQPLKKHTHTRCEANLINTTLRKHSRNTHMPLVQLWTHPWEFSVRSFTEWPPALLIFSRITGIRSIGCFYFYHNLWEFLGFPQSNFCLEPALSYLARMWLLNT